jgi:anti-anti-sigma factor
MLGEDLADVTPAELADCEFAIRVSDGEPPIVKVGGELDMLTAPAMTTVARRFIESPGSLILDLEAVTFIASSGLSALVQLRQAAAAAGGACVLVATGQAVLRSLDVTGLTATLQPCSSLGDARRRLARG